MKHVGTYDRSTVVLLGYNKNQNRIKVLDPEKITVEDREWIGKLLEGRKAQSTNFLYNATYDVYHPSGKIAWVYLNENLRGALEVPAFEVSIQDKDQAEEWMGTPSNFDSRAGRDIGGILQEDDTGTHDPFLAGVYPIQEPSFLSVDDAKLNDYHAAVAKSAGISLEDIKSQAVQLSTVIAPVSNGSSNGSSDLLNAIKDVGAEIEGLRKVVSALAKEVKTLKKASAPARSRAKVTPDA